MNDLIIKRDNVCNTLIDYLLYALRARDNDDSIQKTIESTSAQMALSAMMYIVSDGLTVHQNHLLIKLYVCTSDVVSDLKLLKEAYDNIVEVFGKPDPCWESGNRSPENNSRSWEHFERLFNEIEARKKQNKDDEEN